VPIKAASLQFSLAHPAAVSVIPGASKPDRIKEDHDALKAKIPDDFRANLLQRFAGTGLELQLDRQATDRRPA
jgi:D-threo-aldose 1-dehydrogenase